MKNPFLTGEKVYLRTINEHDLTATYREWFNDEEVCKFNSHHRFPNYDENMTDYFNRVIRSRENLILAICDKKSDSHIGNISLQNIDTLNRTAEFAIIVGDKAHWGKGAGKEAARLLLRHIGRKYRHAEDGGIAWIQRGRSVAAGTFQKRIVQGHHPIRDADRGTQRREVGIDFSVIPCQYRANETDVRQRLD